MDIIIDIADNLDFLKYLIVCLCLGCVLEWSQSQAHGERFNPCYPGLSMTVGGIFYIILYV